MATDRATVCRIKLGSQRSYAEDMGAFFFCIVMMI